jgi:hypothetical protein
MDIAGTLAAITAALGLAKELHNIDHQFDKAELRLKVAELTTALADAKIGLVDVADQLRAKDAQIEKLREKLAFRAAKLIDKGQFRYFADDDGNAKGTPICPRCERNGEFLVLVQDCSRGIGRITYSCPGCKSNYGPHVPRAE